MPKKSVETLTSKTGKPMGDCYGSGVKQKVGRVIYSSTVNPVTTKQLKTPPRKLA